MIKVFISQPMKGLSNERIFKARTEAFRGIRKKLGPNSPVYIIGSLNDDGVVGPSGVKNPSLWYLGETIKMLADADAAYFLDGWADTIECFIEHEVCKLYGIEIIKD